MTWLLPSALAIAAGAALVAIALHFIARSRPLAEPLPTARFVPDRPIQARARSVALTDVALLLLRLAAIATIGLAIAGPIHTANGRIARVVLVDRSRAVANATELRDSARVALAAADIAIPFDSAAAVLRSAARIDSIPLSGARGSLSAALAAAMRAVALLPPNADSVELTIVSPLAVEEMDAATPRLRAAWPGRVRLVRVAAAASEQPATRVEINATSNDPVVAGLSLMGVVASAGTVRVVRTHLAPADSAWARAAGHVLVHWPATDTSASWPRRTVIDAVGGVTSATGTVVARFPRLWQLDGRAPARWADGVPAAVEHVVGDGCIRDVGILMDPASDVTLHVPFRRFAAALLAPCGGARRVQPASAPAMASLVGSGPLAATALLRDREASASRWTIWLLALGALLLIIELALRRSRGRPV